MVKQLMEKESKQKIVFPLLESEFQVIKKEYLHLWPHAEAQPTLKLHNNGDTIFLAEVLSPK